MCHLLPAKPIAAGPCTCAACAEEEAKAMDRRVPQATAEIIWFCSARARVRAGLDRLQIDGSGIEEGSRSACVHGGGYGRSVDQSDDALCGSDDQYTFGRCSLAPMHADGPSQCHEDIQPHGVHRMHVWHVTSCTSFALPPCMGVCMVLGYLTGYKVTNALWGKDHDSLVLLYRFLHMFISNNCKTCVNISMV
jgi:hypothetical protein